MVSRLSARLCDRLSQRLTHWLPTCLGLLACAAGPASAAPGLLAQSESFMVGPGSSVGPSTKVKPKNCVTKPDGSITCDTQLENSPSDTQARPQFDLFKN